MISSLVLMKWPTNVGFAIGTLERLFFDIALELAEGDSGRVHFTYTETASGPPRSLPENFGRYSKLDIANFTIDTRLRLAELVRTERPQFALTFDMQPLHPMYRVMRSGGVRTIISYWGAPISGVSARWKLALKRAQLYLSRSAVDGLIFESQAMVDLAIHGRGVPRSMIDLVRLGVDTERFQPGNSDYVHVALRIPPERRVVVFTGHCMPRKGIKTLVEAAIDLLAKRKRTDVCFLICGNRANESAQYEQMISGLNLVAPWVRFAGYRTDVAQIFRSAFCGVIPSTGWDSFTLSSLEMAASGLPIVASRLQGLAEAVVHEETGLLFTPGDAVELADCLERLLDAPDAARALGRAGRVRCERELSVEVQRREFAAAVRRRIAAS